MVGCFEHSWEFSVMLNPEHDAMSDVRVLERARYSLHPRMWAAQGWALAGRR